MSLPLDGQRKTTKEWLSRDSFLRRCGWLRFLTDGKHLLMSVFSEPSVRRRGWWEKLDPDKRSVKELNGVYQSLPLCWVAQIKWIIRTSGAGWRGISCLSHFPNSHQIPTRSPWFLARNHHRWRLRSRTNSLDFPTWWEKCGPHHLTGVLWVQLWLKPAGLTQFGVNQDGMVGKTERWSETSTPLSITHLLTLFWGCVRNHLYANLIRAEIPSNKIGGKSI